MTLTARLRRHAAPAPRPVYAWELIEAELRRARIGARVTDIYPGSRITAYAVDVAPGTLAAATSDTMAGELARALRVHRVRLTVHRGALLVEVTRDDFAPLPLADLAPGSGTAVPIGLDVLLDPVVLDLAEDRTCHVLVCGQTGSGKSELLRTLVVGLARQNTPDALRLVLIDGKGETFPDLGRLGHLAEPVVSDPRAGPAALQRAVAELERRASGWTHRQVVVVDELAAILRRSREASEHLCTLTELGRSRGVHVVAATQHATAEVLGGSIARANFACRITGRVVDADASKLATGRRGLEAHLLSDRGDVLVVDSEVRRVQVALAGQVDVARLPVGDCRASTVVMTDEVPASSAPHWSHRPNPAGEDAVVWIAAQAVHVGGEWRLPGVGKIAAQFRVGKDRAGELQSAAAVRLSGASGRPETVAGVARMAQMEAAGW